MNLTAEQKQKVEEGFKKLEETIAAGESSISEIDKVILKWTHHRKRLFNETEKMRIALRMGRELWTTKKGN